MPATFSACELPVLVLCHSFLAAALESCMAATFHGLTEDLQVHDGVTGRRAVIGNRSPGHQGDDDHDSDSWG